MLGSVPLPQVSVQGNSLTSAGLQQRVPRARWHQPLTRMRGRLPPAGREDHAERPEALQARRRLLRHLLQHREVPGPRAERASLAAQGECGGSPRAPPPPAARVTRVLPPQESDSEGPELSDWERYAAEEYDLLVAEEAVGEPWEDG